MKGEKQLSCIFAFLSTVITQNLYCTICVYGKIDLQPSILFPLL